MVGILKVDGLPGFKKINPMSKQGLYTYASVEFAGCAPMQTTKVSVEGTMNLAVNFDEEIWIPVWVPSMCKRFALTVMNKGKWVGGWVGERLGGWVGGM